MSLSGAITNTPGKVFAAGEKITRAKLNQLGSPVSRINEGAVGLRELNHDQVRSLVPNVNRNVLINGNFDIWQRGGYANIVGLPTTLGTTANYEYGPDRWSLGLPTGATHRAISRQSFDLGQTDVPNEPTYYLKWDQTTSEATPTLSQPIEDVRTLAGKVVTVSWWMRAETSFNVTCSLRQFFGGSPGTSRVVAATTGGTAALTGNAQWVKFSAKFTVPSLVGQAIGGIDSSLILQFILPTGAFKIYFAQVQLEEAALPTEYETHSAQYELGRCERYYETHGGIMAAGNVQVIALPIDLAAITGAGDVVTEYVPGFAFKLLSVAFVVTKPATTAAKLVTLNLEIETTNVTGGAIALTSANCTPLGAQVAGTSITAQNVGVAASKLSVEAASVTAFAEGQGVLLIRLQNIDAQCYPNFNFATRKYAAPVLTVLTVGVGTGGHFLPNLDVGYYQDLPNSVISPFMLAAEAEIKV